MDLPNPNGLLRPGMYATAHIVLQERRNAWFFPLSAIVREGKQAYCWVARDGRAMRIPITLGLQVENDVEVVSGLKDDELVVQSQAAPLQEGRFVEPLGVRSSVEERLHLDRMVDQFPPVLVVADAKGRDRCDEERLAGLRDSPKGLTFRPQFLAVAPIDHKLALGKLHLADVDAVVYGKSWRLMTNYIPPNLPAQPKFGDLG